MKRLLLIVLLAACSSTPDEVEPTNDRVDALWIVWATMDRVDKNAICEVVDLGGAGIAAHTIAEGSGDTSLENRRLIERWLLDACA